MELSIPITKAKRALVLDSTDLDPALLEEALVEGLKVILNAKMTAFKTSEATEDELPAMRDAAFAKAQQNLADFKAGKRKSRAAAATTADGTELKGALKTEAMRIARNMIKDELKKAKIPIREVPAATITAMASKMLASSPAIIAQAQANLAAKPAVEHEITLAGLGFTGVDAALHAKYESEKKEAKSQLSASTASKMKPRRQPEHTAH